MAAAATAAASRALRKMATSAVRVQARGMATRGDEAWDKATDLSKQLGTVMNKKMNEENWAEAKRTSEKLSSLMKEPPEALSLQDIKLSQLQTELYQVKAEAKFYYKASYTIFGVFACALIAIPSQMRYEDAKLEAELKSIEKRVIAIEKGDSVAAEDTGDIKTEAEESDASEESDAEAEDNAAGAGDGWWFLKWF